MSKAGWETAGAFLRIYALLVAGIAVSMLTAYCVGLAGLYLFLYLTPLYWIVLLSPFVIVVFAVLMIDTLSAGTLHVIFWSYAVLVGLSFGGLFMVADGSELRLAAVAAATFLLASSVGYLTRFSLEFVRFPVLIGLAVVVLTSLFAIAEDAHFLELPIAILSIAVMMALVARDTQALKLSLSEEGARSARTVLIGALTLYLDVLIFSPGLARLAGLAAGRFSSLGRLTPIVARTAEGAEEQ